MRTNNLQNFIIYFFLNLSLFLLNFKNLSILGIILGTILSFLIILFLKKINYSNSKIYFIVIFICSILLNTISLNKITYFISNNILREFSNILISLTLILLVLFLVYKGKKTILNVLILTSYFIFFNFILGFLANIPYLNLDYLNLDILNSKNIILETLTYTFITIYSYFLTTSFMNKEASFKSLFITSLTNIIIYILVISILSLTLTNIYLYPYLVIYKKVELIGFINRIEIIFSMNYLFCFNFFLLISFYELKNILSKFIKKEKKLNYLFLLILIFIFLFSLVTISKYTS